MTHANHLQCSIGGQFYAVVGLQYNQSLNALCGSFSAQLSPALAGTSTSLLGKEVMISCGEWQRHCRVEQLSFDAPTRLTIAGRDRISLLVDSAVEAKEFKGAHPLSHIVTTLLHGLNITVDPAHLATSLSNFSVNPGETACDALDRAARYIGGSWISPEGVSLRLALPSTEISLRIDNTSPLVGFAVQIDHSERYGTYVIKAKSLDLFSEGELVKIVRDPELPAEKKKLIAVANTDQMERAHARALKEKTVRAQRSTTYQATFAGHHPISLGSTAEIACYGFSHRGMVKSLSYEIALGNDCTQSTTVEIGARLDEAN